MCRITLKAATMTCLTCLTEEVRQADAYALRCSHSYCKQCWGGILSANIADAKTDIKCPQYSDCKVVLGLSIRYMEIPKFGILPVYHGIGRWGGRGGRGRGI